MPPWSRTRCLSRGLHTTAPSYAEGPSHFTIARHRNPSISSFGQEDQPGTIQWAIRSGLNPIWPRLPARAPRRLTGYSPYSLFTRTLAAHGPQAALGKTAGNCRLYPAESLASTVGPPLGIVTVTCISPPRNGIHLFTPYIACLIFEIIQTKLNLIHFELWLEQKKAIGRR